jgi:hypothetical protein
MKNNKAKISKPKKPAKSKVYTQKKPAKKLKLKKVEADANSINNVNYNPPVYSDNNDTYTTQDNSDTTYITVEGDTLSKYPVTTSSHSSTNLNDAYDKYSKVVEEEQSEDTKRSEILPQNNEHTNMIVILIGIAAFAALLLLLI